MTRCRGNWTKLTLPRPIVFGFVVAFVVLSHTSHYVLIIPLLVNVGDISATLLNSVDLVCY